MSKNIYFFFTHYSTLKYNQSGSVKMKYLIKFIYWCLIGWWLVPLIFIIKKANEQQRQKIKQNDNQYYQKKLMTDNEKYFYNIIAKNFENKYLIVPQVNLASFVNKEKQYENEYQNELFRNIDFGIFDKNTTLPILMIEINDNTHNQAKRKYRDIKVKEILEKANINLITFYTEYSNKEDYIVKRIKENLNNEEKKEEN